MNASQILTKWKSGEQNEAAVLSIVGSPVIDEQLLDQVQGGGPGRINSFSAECFYGVRCDFWNW